MKFISKIILTSVLVIVTSACASKKEKKLIPPNFSQQDQAMKAFEKANELFDNENFAAAAKAYDKITVDKPVSTFDGLILFNAGLAHQYNDECETAVKRFRKLIRFTKRKKATSLRLQAKLRLSDAYSCLGQSNKSLVLLVEVFKQRKLLPAAIGLAEVPAKLAAGYSRMGNRKMADFYFKKADSGLRQLESQNQKSSEQDKLMSKTLFTMGDTSQVKFDTKNHKTYFRTLKTLQKYLLRSISYGIEPWTEKATSQLVTAYEYTWNMVERVRPPENLNSVRGGRVAKQERSKILQEALDGIRDLEKEKLPTDKTKQVKSLFKRLSRTKLKIRNYLVAEVPGSELTEEARRLQAPRREGRVKSGKTILERKKKN